MQECFAELGYGRGALPETEAATQEVISIPVFPELRAEERAEVVAAIKAFYQ
jgi:dTDP-4-amino-4,6-dideoxygalactose transaminase